MSIKSPFNPQVVATYKIRGFDGVSGPENKVLRRPGQKNQDFSKSICNDIQDLQLGLKGSGQLRTGFRKIDSSGDLCDTQGIFGVCLSGNTSYGVVKGGNLTVIDATRSLTPRLDPFPLTPVTTFPTLSSSEQVPSRVGEPYP